MLIIITITVINYGCSHVSSRDDGVDKLPVDTCFVNMLSSYIHDNNGKIAWSFVSFLGTNDYRNFALVCYHDESLCIALLPIGETDIILSPISLDYTELIDGLDEINVTRLVENVSLIRDEQSRPIVTNHMRNLDVRYCRDEGKGVRRYNCLWINSKGEVFFDNRLDNHRLSTRLSSVVINATNDHSSSYLRGERGRSIEELIDDKATTLVYEVFFCNNNFMLSIASDGSFTTGRIDLNGGLSHACISDRGRQFFNGMPTWNYMWDHIFFNSDISHTISHGGTRTYTIRFLVKINESWIVAYNRVTDDGLFRLSKLLEFEGTSITSIFHRHMQYGILLFETSKHRTQNP